MAGSKHSAEVTNFRKRPFGRSAVASTNIGGQHTNVSTMLQQTREQVSQITGSDLSKVPIDSGDTNGQKALAHQANVLLSTRATLHDVAHELAHVAQQNTNSGRLLDAGAAERQADQVADAVQQNRHIKIAPGQVPQVAIQGATDPYDRTGFSLPAPPKGMSAKELREQLKAKITSGEISSFALAGIASPDPAERFMLNALILLANKKRWGSELDLLTELGGGKGMLTVRFDDKGHAEAIVIGKSAPVVAKSFVKVKDAVEHLKKKYSLDQVKGEQGRNWSIDDLNKVIAAWSRLSKTEAAALVGYSLIRSKTVSEDGESLQGLTDRDDDVIPGETTVKHTREMRFSDKAFSADDNSFIGDKADAAPASFETLIHEVGHAIESKAFDDLNAVAAIDSASSNKAQNKAHADQLATNRAINKALKKRYKQSDISAGQPLMNAVKNAQRVLQLFEKKPEATEQKAAQTAITNRNDVKAKIADTNAVVKALSHAMTLQDSYFSATKRFATARNTASVSRAAADALKSGDNTLRVQNFVDFVDKHNILPPTAYAKKHWPAKPAEFLNEAFSLWKNDPVFFARYSPQLKKWFDDGNHLK